MLANEIRSAMKQQQNHHVLFGVLHQFCILYRSTHANSDPLYSTEIQFHQAS